MIKCVRSHLANQFVKLNSIKVSRASWQCLFGAMPKMQYRVLAWPRCLQTRSRPRSRDWTQMHANRLRWRFEYVTNHDNYTIYLKSSYLTGDWFHEISVDSIINFGENLPEKELSNAIRESNAADLTIVLGTSMRVRPACELPTYCKKSGRKMIIVNLQKTPCKSIPRERL